MKSNTNFRDVIHKTSVASMCRVVKKGFCKLLKDRYCKNIELMENA